MMKSDGEKRRDELDLVSVSFRGQIARAICEPDLVELHYANNTDWSCTHTHTHTHTHRQIHILAHMRAHTHTHTHTHTQTGWASFTLHLLVSD